MNTLRKIRSLAVTRANQLQRCHRHLAELAPAFAQWTAGAIYVCKTTSTYRFRFGANSKSVTPWSALACSIFPTPAAFAFAAMVLGDALPQQVTESAPASAPASAGRVNVVELAAA